MTPQRFLELLARVSVRDVAARADLDPCKQRNEGILVEGMTRDELSELVTLAGHALGAVPDSAALNPEWLSAEATIKFPGESV